MTNKTNDNIPKIVLDQDDIQQRRPNQQTKGKASPSQTQPKQPEAIQAKAKTSGFMIFSSILLYALVAGGAYYAYQENINNKAQLAQAEARIVELENQLSATGEEMGESTVAIKVKLEGLIQKTDKLWQEMDKLWASAWRRNQSEIKAIVAQNKKQQAFNSQTTTSLKNASAYIKDIQDKQTENQFAVAALTDRFTTVEQLQQTLTKLNSQLAALENKSSDRDKSQVELATSVSQLELSVNALIEQIDSLKSKSSTKTKKSPAAVAKPKTNQPTTG